MENISISAIKVSAKIPEVNIRDIERFCDQNTIRSKRFNRDHLVVYDSSFTFTIFKKSEFSFADQHVNITKIKGFDDIQNAIQDLAWIIDVDPDLIFYNIDTITAVGNIEKKIDLEEFISNNSDLTDFIRFNREIFPGKLPKTIYKINIAEQFC